MRRLAVVLLAFGALFGFASAAHHGWHSRRDAFERHVADICTEAALRTAPRAGALAP
jgi:hypothetical protein